MLIAAAILWFITVIIPTAICRGIGHLSRPYERPQFNYDSQQDTYTDDDDDNEEQEDENEESPAPMSDPAPHVYYEDDKDFIFPRIKVK